MLRSIGITMLSITLTASVVGNAYFQKKQFYPTVVYITKSNPTMAVIYTQSFIFVLILGQLMKKIFFGSLRAAELEHLMERAWYAMTETCLAFTVFRDDFSPKFVALFTVLLFVKSFHWLGEDRIDFMERSPIITFPFHLRIVGLLTLLAILDVNLLGYAIRSTLSKGATVQVVFGFEYAILLTIIANITIKYTLHTVALYSDTPWENKAVFLLYTELVMGFIKVILYILFMAIMMRISMLPLFAFRPMYYTMRAFKKAFNDVILSRRAIRNMNTLYPDATAEELAAADNVCIICREEMVTASKKLPCNHIFHTACLHSWFQRQQTCPTCRLNILNTPTTPAPQAAPPRPQEPVRAFQPPQFPFPWANPLQQPQQQPAAAAGADNQGAAQTPTTPQPPPAGFPFFCPPFPFMPFSIPPPADLSNLSTEQLAQMEQVNRAGIEARLQCLRNIQLLLDASVMLMQQYSASAAAAALHLPGNLSPQPPTTGSAGSSNVAGSSTIAGRSSAPDTTKAAEGASASPSTSAMTGASSAAGSFSAQNAGTSSPADKGNVPSTSQPSAEQEEARRRRLAKFSQPATE